MSYSLVFLSEISHYFKDDEKVIILNEEDLSSLSLERLCEIKQMLEKQRERTTYSPSICNIMHGPSMNLRKEREKIDIFLEEIINAIQIKAVKNLYDNE